MKAKTNSLFKYIHTKIYKKKLNDLIKLFNKVKNTDQQCLPETVDDLRLIALHHEELKKQSVYLMTIGYSPTDVNIHGQPHGSLLSINKKGQPELTLAWLHDLRPNAVVNHFCIIPSNSFASYDKSKSVHLCYKLELLLRLVNQMWPHSSSWLWMWGANQMWRVCRIIHRCSGLPVKVKS